MYLSFININFRVYMTNQARHNQVVKNDDEANNRYESANSWRSCFRDRVCENGPGFLCLQFRQGYYM
ncbi:hypothetical protein UUU_07370 [Klebsiella pneumoniae subsp. pneumoniae DSM 30104 = JCM 1662 = NBRC 14940]|nr:hypothetical protein UUU_07370 [Klebsiella pneumoniae subsp. pneumoniae DSM 30104 = JCM 1662 = NBRC 14940]